MNKILVVALVLLMPFPLQGDTPDLSPILIPTLYNGPGAFGSTWWSHVLINNHMSEDFVTPKVLFHVSDTPIPEEATKPYVPTNRWGWIVSPKPPGGLILYAPTGGVHDLAFRARFGTGDQRVETSSEMPVVREPQFVRGPVRLPGVPIHYTREPIRSQLRIYGIDAVPGTMVRVDVRLADVLAGEPLASRVIALDVPPSPEGTELPIYPAFGQLLLQDAFPQELVAGYTNLNLTVVPLPLSDGETPRIWAFISITENVANRVLIQQPQ